MITENFNVKNLNRLIELQGFIRENMPTCRFHGDPMEFNNGVYLVTIHYEIEDINKIGILHNKWYDTDNVEDIVEKPYSLLVKKFKSYFNNLMLV